MKTRSAYSLIIFICSLVATFTLSTGQSRAATLLVSNNNDSGPGSLRQAIQDNLTGGGGNTIVFSNTVTGAITLVSQLTISVNATITGPGANVLKVSGNNSRRVFNITGGTVSISNLTISDGRVLGTNGLAASKGENVVGGGILNGASASLTLTGCVISNNTAMGGTGGPSNGGGGNGFGGGIENEGTLTLNQCALDANTAQGGPGGGASGMSGEGWGGGYYGGGTVTMVRCSISGNNAIAGAGPIASGNGVGGGIYNFSTMNLTNCTIANNVSSGGANDSGGGIDNNGTLTIRSCTIAGNQSDRGGGLRGGGNLGNTIVATNSATISSPDVSGTVTSSDYNLIQNTSGATISGTTTHNITGVNPLLGPLQNNGGLTRTMAPLPGSAVIDKGTRFGATTDQRGLPRPYDTEFGNAAGGDASDIGAVEINPGTLVVINNNDSGAGSLRQAILDNNGYGGGNTITFSNTVTGVIPVIAGDLAVNASANIVGPGAKVLKVSGNNSQRIFTLFGGPISISGLTIGDGRVVGNTGTGGSNGSEVGGAGILNINSVVTLTSCVISNNSAIGGQGGPSDGTGGNAKGGAVANFGIVALNQCALDNNTALGGAGGGAFGMGGQGWGGGIYNEGTATVSRCSISVNNATAGNGGGGPGGGVGGGVYSFGTVGLTNCTVANNIASGSSFDSGGGIENNGSLVLRSCTIAGNQADFGGGLSGNANAGNTIWAGNTAGSGADASGNINSFDYNLIQSFSGANISGLTTHVIIGQDPLLGPLADNGGATRTMALRFGSPAIDKGSAFGAATDQRGAPRPFDFATVANAGGGDGSDIGAFELGTPTLNILRSAPNVVLSWLSYYSDFTLEAVGALPPLNNWATVAGTPVVVGNQYNVTDTAAAGNKFYRLKSR